MAADIEFNVRNGMTVGSNKHLVLDVNGALSGSDITCTTGTILSGGSDLRDLFDLSDIETILASNSGNWNEAYGWDDHSTQNYATSAYVDHKVSSLVDSAPATLDTLNELAAALGDDANFSTTVTSAIGTKWTQDDTKISNWDTAHGWGDHSTQNYATTTGDTFTGAVSFEGKITNTGGAKLEVMNASNNSGATHGIYMWDSSTPDWVQYMAKVGTGLNPEGGTTVASIDGRVNHAFRFRSDNRSSNSFIFENSDDVALFSIGSNNGKVYSRDSFYPSNQTTHYVDSTRIQDWQGTTSTVSTNSADWDSTHASVVATSANWNEAYGWDDHSTQNYATSAYVDHKVSTLVDSAPATLDTLNELAAALGDDANFSTTVTSAIGTKWTQDDTKISNWDTAYGWGDHSTQNYATTTGDTFTGEVNFSGKLQNTGGAKLEVMNGTNGGTGHGIYFWQSNDTNWVHYLCNSLANNTNNPKGEYAPAGISGSTNYALRYRAASGAGNSFIFENSGNATVFQIDAQFGKVYSRHNFYPSNQTTHYVDSTRIQDWQGTTSTVSTNSANWNTAYGWGDHNTQNYATSAYVDNKVSDLVDSAPAALDTLNELAAALGDDANFSTTITNQIGDKWTQDNTKISNWDNTYTAVNNNSAGWDSVYASVLAASSNWESAHGWGNHADGNYLTSVSENDVTQHQDALHVTTTVNNNSADWESAHAWGNHADENYLTSETNTSLTLSNDTLSYTDETGTTNTISLEAYTGEGVTTIADATDTSMTSLSGGDVLVYVNGTTQQWQNKKDRAALEDLYNYANTNFYSEMTYSNTNQLTGVYVWVTDSKSTALFERDLTYNGSGQLTSVVTRDVQGGSTRATLTKNLAYTTTGALSSTTRSYS